MREMVAGAFKSTKTRKAFRRRLLFLSPLFVPGDYRLVGRLAARLEDGSIGSDAASLAERMRESPAAERIIDRLPHARMSLGDRARPGEKFNLALYRRDAVILMTPERGAVLRVSTVKDGSDPEVNRQVIETIVANARWLRQSYPCPAVEPFETGITDCHAAREDYVAGETLLDSPESTWEPAYRQLLAASIKHARFCQGTWRINDALDQLSEWSLPPWLSSVVERNLSAMASVLDGVPLLKGHSDCHTGNILVQSDGLIRMIDMERAQELPFFFDALSLLRGDTPVDMSLRRKFLAGEFDSDLGRLWESAGQSYRAEDRAVYLLCMAFAHAFRPQFHNMKPGRRRDKFTNAVSKFAGDCGWT